MKKYDNRMVAILGTVILHLVAAIIFMSFQLRTLRKQNRAYYEIELTQPQVTQPVVKKQVTEKALTAENIVKGDNDLMNIARNLANRSDQNINKSEYIDKVKEELIKSGKLGVNNYIDEQKKQAESKNDEDITLKSDTAGNKKSGQPTESQKMASNYKGPTRIYYDLQNRTHTYLPLPIYMCEGSGKVVLSIGVNQKGEVEDATVVSNQSTASDPCLFETALATAKLSRFNADINAPRLEKGTLTYHFVAQ